MRRFLLASLLVGAFAASASANGRPAGTSTIHFRHGHPMDIVGGMTFGLVISHDGGATWNWMCEKAVGYSGLYDPDYSYSQSGAIFATTFGGFKVQRPPPDGDSCTFAATPPGNTFASQDELGPDEALYLAAADPMDAKIYKSTDDGKSFPTSASPGMNNDWWESLVVAPSDPKTIYLSGYRLTRQCSHSTRDGQSCLTANDCPGVKRFEKGSCDSNKTFLMDKSTNGGTSFVPITTSGMTTSTNSAIDIVGIDPTDPTLVYAIVTLENGSVGDGLYKSTNSGTTWTKLLGKLDTMHFVQRANGDIVAATQSLGASVSHNQGTSWTDLVNPPHINCMVESPGGEVWACTQNYGMPGISSDGYGIMKSSDLVNWTGVLKYQNIAGPVTCPTGTAQQDQCVGSVGGMPSAWCCLAQQLGITATPPGIDCTQPPLACGFVGNADGATDAGSGSPKVNPPAGCCDTGGGGSGGLALGLLVALSLARRRQS